MFQITNKGIEEVKHLYIEKCGEQAIGEQINKALRKDKELNKRLVNTYKGKDNRL